MKVAKDYVLKLGFVFKEILKAGPGVFFLSIGSMIITGVSQYVGIVKFKIEKSKNER